MQKKDNFKKLCSLCLCIVLIATVALLTTACTNNGKSTDGNISAGNISSGNTLNVEMTEIGQGATSFTFVVSDKEGRETYFAVSTDKATVGEALMENGLIDGEVGTYGLYVKSVNGLVVDYDTDGMYWAFYIGEELSPKGVDMTDIVGGQIYRFVAEKG